jgi:hypothetical protein
LAVPVKSADGAGSANSANSYALNMAPAKYGLVVPAGSKVQVTDLVSGAVLGSYTGDITYAGAVGGLDVQLLKLAVVQ